jgi:hypothetical protein
VAKLPSFKKILPEQFPDLPWLPELVRPLNNFMESVTNALNQQLTFADNLDAVVRNVTLDGTYPVKVAWTKTNKPVACWVGQCRELNADHTTFTTALFLDWEFAADGTLQINNVTGITPTETSKYTLTLVAITG